MVAAAAAATTAACSRILAIVVLALRGRTARDSSKVVNMLSSAWVLS
jgi:hypothetical protein